MRRLFIIRKDLHLSPGKLAAMVAHASELWWIKTLICSEVIDSTNDIFGTTHDLKVKIPWEIWSNYICDIYTKTICEARNYNHLMKILEVIQQLREDKICNLVMNKDWGKIDDKCLTELKPENEDGTTTVGIWFKPLSDDISHILSKKYKLYKD